MWWRLMAAKRAQCWPAMRFAAERPVATTSAESATVQDQEPGSSTLCANSDVQFMHENLRYSARRRQEVRGTENAVGQRTRLVG